MSVIPGLHHDVAAVDVHVGSSGFGSGDGHGQDEDWCVGCSKEHHLGTLVEYSHHSSSSPSASATPTSADNTRLGAPHPHPTLPLHEDVPESVDGNYSVGGPGKFPFSIISVPLLISP